MSLVPNEPRWPPRSPHEALLSSPSGRNKIRQHHGRTSPSPSPLKRPRTGTLNRVKEKVKQVNAQSDDDEEDEETLQLRLETLQAQLKLKKLQARKVKLATTGSDVENDGRASTRPSSRVRSVVTISNKGRLTDANHTYHSAPSTNVQIPLSPPRKQVPVGEVRSPGRILLGIDKGLKGRNVSLRKPPKNGTNREVDPFMTDPHHVNAYSSLRTCNLSYAGGLARPKSFGERIAENRQHENERKERANGARKQRSTGFELHQQDMDVTKELEAITQGIKRSETALDRRKTEFSRDEILAAIRKPDGGLIHRKQTFPSEEALQRQGNSSSRMPSNKPLRRLSPEPTELPASKVSPTRPASATNNQITSCRVSPPTDLTFFDPHSSTHLTKRLTPHSLLTRTLSSKTTLLLPNLLHTIKSPSYILPDDLEGDYVVLGIIASKSSPLTHNDAHKATTNASLTSTAEAAESETNARGKYMVLTLTDLKWSVDLFLFTTAYTRYWKLNPGTLIAILNPSIMPPPPGKTDTGRFSLALSSSDDTVLEIGTSRDLSFCKAIKKDGKTCPSWTDKRHTEFCEWHVDRLVEKTRKGRMEVNSISAPFGPGGKRTGFFGGRRKDTEKKDDGLLKEGPQYDRTSRSTYFLTQGCSAGKSAARLLDLDSETASRVGNTEERVRKRLAEREREREIARKLGEGGNGAGGEYLRLKTCAPGGIGDSGKERRGTEGFEGLLANKAGDVQLSPLKRKRVGKGEGEGARKKTRFVTEKGIREAGRESLGVGFGDGAESGKGVGGKEEGREGEDSELDII